MRDKIKEFLHLTGAVSGMAEVIEKANSYMLSQLDAQYPPETVEEIKSLNEKYQKILQARLDEVTEKFTSLYAEYYNEEDMDALLAFHRSPIAQKHREVQTKIIDRAIEISADFNKELLSQLGSATLNRQMN